MNKHTELQQQPAQRDGIVEALYFAAADDLRYLVTDTDTHNRLGFMDPDNILALLADKLPYYCGDLTLDAFGLWARDFVLQETQRFIATTAILKAHKQLIDSAIYFETRTFATDRAVEVEDLRNDIAKLIFERAISLSKPGRASLKTRLRKLVRRHCIDYYVKKTKRRLRIVTEFKTTLSRKGVEVFSSQELASIRADEMEREQAA
jgi:hypothetical protein